MRKLIARLTWRLVNQAFVKQFLPEGNPIGQSVRSTMLKVEQPDFLLAQAPDDWLEIIGVVGDARDDGLDHPNQAGCLSSIQLRADSGRFADSAFERQVQMAAIQAVKVKSARTQSRVGRHQRSHTLPGGWKHRGGDKGVFIATLFSLFALLGPLPAARRTLQRRFLSPSRSALRKLAYEWRSELRASSILRLVISSTALNACCGFGGWSRLGLGARPYRPRLGRRRQVRAIR